mmetsp:Transcript_17764/g.51432  ORF Transcript_17764/g.51432 Transcript_17764/m.51432 type:complete len:230 (-) Transcript_17764:1032-1721(-)
MKSAEGDILRVDRNGAHLLVAGGDQVAVAREKVARELPQLLRGAVAHVLRWVRHKSIGRREGELVQQRVHKAPHLAVAGKLLGCRVVLRQEGVDKILHDVPQLQRLPAVGRVNATVLFEKLDVSAVVEDESEVGRLIVAKDSAQLGARGRILAGHAPGEVGALVGEGKVARSHRLRVDKVVARVVIDRYGLELEGGQEAADRMVGAEVLARGEHTRIPDLHVHGKEVVD